MEAFMRRVATVICLALAGLAVSTAAVFAHRQDSPPSVAIYDPNPAHLWNRLYATLLVRTDRDGKRYGQDSLDPQLWAESEHLLAEPSHQQAVQVLDEFLRTHGETLIHDPIKRVILQRDLWAIFDWSLRQYSANERPQYTEQKQELQGRLAEVLRRLALSPDEIKALPDNYSQALASGTFAREYDPQQPGRSFLPPDLFDPRGPWVCISPSPESDTGVTPMHLYNFSGRSGFLVFVRLPEGRKVTYDYFQKLWDFPEPYVHGPEFASDQAPVNPNLPSFPAETQVALVRRMTVFDNQGNLAASSLTESVQIRVYRSITSAEERNFGSGDAAQIVKNSGQDFFEFRLSRPLLFSGKNGGLRALGPEEKSFPRFNNRVTTRLNDARASPIFRANSRR
jgi:hypothetical protein